MDFRRGGEENDFWVTYCNDLNIAQLIEIYHQHEELHNDLSFIKTIYNYVLKRIIFHNESTTRHILDFLKNKITLLSNDGQRAGLRGANCISNINDVQFGHGSGDTPSMGDSDDEINDGEPLIQLISSEKNTNKKYRHDRRKIKFKVNDVPENADPNKWIRGVIDQVLNHATENVPAHHKVGFELYPVNDPSSMPFVTFRRMDQMDTEVVLAEIAKYLRSNETFLTDNELIAQLDVIEVPLGGGRLARKGSFLDNFLNNKSSVICIQNDSNICLAIALVVAVASYKYKHQLLDKKSWDYIRKSKLEQEVLAKELCNVANVNLDHGGGVNELSSFQKHFKNEFVLTVYYGCNRMGDKPMFDGSGEVDVEKRRNPRLYLLYHKEHYNVITKIGAYFNTNYFCDVCLKGFYSANLFESHACSNKCPACYSYTDCIIRKEVKIECDQCMREFYGQSCFDAHLNKKPKKRKGSFELVSICDLHKKCQECFKKIQHNKEDEHNCEMIYCPVCKENKHHTHMCYIKTCKPKDVSKYLFIYFDLECVQQKELEKDMFEHEPVLCITQSVCHICLDENDITKDCTLCGVREKIFMGDNCLKDFYSYILDMERSKKYTDIRVISHNMKAYDGHLVLRYIVSATNTCPVVIMNGRSLISMRIEGTNVKFIDSLSYFPMPLSALPKAMGLPSDICKGFFPHFFNTRENQNYIGPYPDKCFYGYDNMHEQERKTFNLWYNEMKQYTFNMKNDIIKYCKMDVSILRQACSIFRNMFLKENNIDPFIHASTIAGAAMCVYRSNYLKPESIGIVPRGGYRFADRQSSIAIQWIEYEAFNRKIVIQHAGRGREWYEPGCGKVDGYFVSDEGERFALEFQGCWYHGCLCLAGGRDLPIKNDAFDTLNERRERTLLKIKRLKKRGLNVIEMTECTFRSMKKHNKQLIEFLKNHYVPLNKEEPLEIRDAFYGGRVNCAKRYYKADISKGEKIFYQDVTSLYPCVNKCDPYPIGHPVNILVGEECKNIDLTTKFGFVKCRILPPKTLYHPITPTRCNSRLLFPLCYTCAEEENNGDCDHDDMQRSYILTIPIIEVNKAVEKGYVVVEIFEILEYNSTQYDPKTKEGGLFADYVNKFLKIKQTASGWPRENMTKSEKVKYIKDFADHEGVHLDFNEICFNPSLRSIAKFLLNSLWGKFGQRNNLPQTEFVHDPSRLLKLLQSPDLTIKCIEPMSEDIYLVNWEYNENIYAPTPTVSEAIAAFTTCHARLRLYELLDKLGEQVLYYDTDSVIYYWRPGLVKLENGNYLGELTDELASYGPESFITEFVSGGPKNYSYSVAINGDVTNPKVVCKVKGITLNCKNSELINFYTMKNLVLQNSKEKIVVFNNKKIRRLKNHTVISAQESKTYQPVYKKRKLLENNDSVPFGYVKG